MALFSTFQGNLEKFSYAVVYDATGRPVPVSRFWHQNPAILVFLRHFGCIACRAHAQEVWTQRADLQKDGARVIFIGNGEPHYIDGFRQEFGLEGAPIFTDPTLRAFQLAGFYRGVTRLINRDSVKNAIALAKDGYKNGNPLDTKSGSHLQMGGVVVVHPGPAVKYHYISEALGDTPEPSTILFADEKPT